MATEQPPPRPNDSTTPEIPPERPVDQRAPAKPPRTRTSIAFSSLTAGAVVLILLLIFILENTQSVKISYFGATGHLALGVGLLLAAVGGALLVGILGTARIAQVRRHAKRRARDRHD